jgi:serine/threonine protein kinase
MPNNQISIFNDIAIEIGKKLNYQKVTFAGKGSFKETFKIIDDDNNVFALKILDPQKCNVIRTKREIDAMMMCNSPFIGKLFNFINFSISGKKYDCLIEEFFDGGTLTQKILNGNIDIVNFKKYGTSLITALNELKLNNLVHRDIKPDNIMFKINSENPCLVDFGIVRILSDVSITASWMPHGPCTPIYASPEQLNNEKQLIKWRADQFSIGIVLGICLTGQHPFQDTGMSDFQITERIEQRASWSKDFEKKVYAMGFEKILKMINPWPVQRYSSINELLEIFK